MNRQIFSLVGTLLFSTMLLTALHAEEGQYRSKLLIDPSGALAEGTALSVEQLEQQLDSLTDSYARASATRHLAQHYVESKQYDKAITYYLEALDTEGLSDISNREILRQLGRVHLLKKDYPAAALAFEQVLQFDLVQETTDYLVLAQAWFHSGNYVSTVAVLDQLLTGELHVEVVQLRQALALYYHTGAFDQSADVLQELLVREPDNADYWHQLTAVYLLQDKQREALDQLTLAYQKRVPFREQDIVLLADLYAVNNQPYDAAHLLQSAIERETIAPSGEHYRKLFDFWLQAREKDKAMTALTHAAQLSGDTELSLHLAQLQGEKENWQAMQESVLNACSSELEDRYVSRANLLLGISQLKLGDSDGARRSFINASLIGGRTAQAAQWLRFMGAEPADKSETRRIVSPCYGSEDKQRKLIVSATDEKPAATRTAYIEPENAQVDVSATKTVPGQRFFSVRHNVAPAELATKAKVLATRLAVSLVRAGGDIDGSLHILFDIAAATQGDAMDFHLAFPTRGNPRASGRFQSFKSEPFRCSYLLYEGTADGISNAWAELARTTREAGYQLTGEARYVFSDIGSASPGKTAVELQLGIQ